jgi:hypothetical protein
MSFTYASIAGNIFTLHSSLGSVSCKNINKKSIRASGVCDLFKQVALMVYCLQKKVTFWYVAEYIALNRILKE